MQVREPRSPRYTLPRPRRLPVHSVNLGTGENGMHPDFPAILSWLLVFLVGYGGWIVGKEIVEILEDALRVILQIR